MKDREIKYAIAMQNKQRLYSFWGLKVLLGIENNDEAKKEIKNLIAEGAIKPFYYSNAYNETLYLFTGVIPYTTCAVKGVSVHG